MSLGWISKLNDNIIINILIVFYKFFTDLLSLKLHSVVVEAVFLQDSRRTHRDVEHFEVCSERPKPG